MDLFKKLNEFLSNRDYHAFLVYGSWGVGKTYAVNEFLKNHAKNYKTIKLSLFGISNINDLVQQAIINEKSFANKFKRIFRSIARISIATTLKHIFNLNIDILANILNSCLEDKHDKNKKYLFVIDDIERKDNLLTIEQILGFVDHFQYDNVKMILITNLDKLNDLDKFKRFKEKVIQDEYCIELPTEDAITSIIDKRYHDCFTKNKIQLKNLRTLIKIKNILQSLHYSQREIDLTLVNCIYYCCLNIFEDRLNKKEYEDNLNEKNISDKKNYELLGLITKGQVYPKVPINKKMLIWAFG